MTSRLSRSISIYDPGMFHNDTFHEGVANGKAARVFALKCSAPVVPYPIDRKMPSQYFDHDL